MAYESAEFEGLGTAFHIDLWGNLLTADHVVDVMRQKFRPHPFVENDRQIHAFDEADKIPLVLLGGYIAYGVAKLPPEALSPIDGIETLLSRDEDPMASWHGRSDARIACDVAALKTRRPPPLPNVDTLLIRLSGSLPEIGETVVALGYPELTVRPFRASQLIHHINDQMSAGFGIVRAVHEKGTSSTFPTPAIEVECNWPKGMSGGPVFNEAGEVIGIVSQGFDADQHSELGTGFAAALPLIPGLRRMLPSLHHDPWWRMGWFVIRDHDRSVFDFLETVQDAQKVMGKLGEGFSIWRGSLKLGPQT